MRIVRVEGRWRVLGCSHVLHDCLECLAYEQGYRVEGVCRALGMGARYLREIFERDVGLTPKEWLAWEQMVVARRMLSCGRDPLAVAERLGFSHPNSFRRAFRSTYGVAPAEFVLARGVPDWGSRELEADSGRDLKQTLGVDGRVAD